jgi:hypothetical protein
MKARRKYLGIINESQSAGWHHGVAAGWLKAQPASAISTRENSINVNIQLSANQ